MTLITFSSSFSFPVDSKISILNRFYTTSFTFLPLKNYRRCIESPRLSEKFVGRGICSLRFPDFLEERKGREERERSAARPIEYRAARVKAARYCEAVDGISGDCPGNVVRAHLDGRARCLYHRLPIDPWRDTRAHPPGRSTLIE